jgi:hypothetical protein
MRLRFWVAPRVHCRFLNYMLKKLLLSAQLWRIEWKLKLFVFVRNQWKKKRALSDIAIAIANTHSRGHSWAWAFYRTSIRKLIWSWNTHALKLLSLPHLHPHHFTMLNIIWNKNFNMFGTCSDIESCFDLSFIENYTPNDGKVIANAIRFFKDPNLSKEVVFLESRDIHNLGEFFLRYGKDVSGR